MTKLPESVEKVLIQNEWLKMNARYYYKIATKNEDYLHSFFPKLVAPTPNNLLVYDRKIKYIHEFTGAEAGKR